MDIMRYFRSFMSVIGWQILAEIRLYPRLIEQLQEEVNSYAGWKDTLNQARAEFWWKCRVWSSVKTILLLEMMSLLWGEERAHQRCGVREGGGVICKTTKLFRFCVVFISKARREQLDKLEQRQRVRETQEFQQLVVLFNDAADLLADLVPTKVADELRGRFPDVVLGRISELLHLGLANRFFVTFNRYQSNLFCAFVDGMELDGPFQLVYECILCRKYICIYSYYVWFHVYFHFSVLLSTIVTLLECFGYTFPGMLFSSRFPD